MDLPARIGRYDVEILLGESGMGRVFLARDGVLGRQVALKVLRDDLGLTPELRSQLSDRLRQEARAAASLSHPAIITLHDMGEDESVGLYLVFELVKGITLRNRVQRGPLPATEVAQLARTLGSALTHAHSAGVLHRDVRPENVMLAPMGAKLADFGIARLPGSTTTSTAAVLGTPAYSAPEALASAVFSARSDQFSLAATLYEALTGAPAFAGESALDVALKIATAVHAPPTSVLASLRGFVHVDAIFDRALAKDAKSRFPSCEGFASVLAAELETPRAAYLLTPISSPVLSRSSIVPRATRRWQNGIALVALAVIVALVALGRLRQLVYGPGGGYGTGQTDGVSLRSVASAFGTAAMQRVVAPGAARHARPFASTATASSAGSGAGSGPLSASPFLAPASSVGEAGAAPHDP